MRLWVGAPPAEVTFATSSIAVEASVLQEIERGAVYRIVVPPGADELRVRSTTAAQERSVRLSERSAPDWIDRARERRQKGDVEGAAALARSKETSGDRVDRALALGLRARIELAAGRPDSSFPLFREAIALHRAEGRLSDAADDGFALAFALNQRSYRYTEARAVLDAAKADTPDYADGQARQAYYRGTLAMETGDVRSALGLLREARVRAARLGLPPLERNAINAYALQLLLVGRTREALDVLGTLERAAIAAADATACEKAEIAINIGFGALLAREEGASDDATAPLERALALANGSCQDKYLRTAALGNVALSDLQRGDPAAARKRLREARADAHEARAAEVLFWHDLDGRIALAEGDPKRALAAFDDEIRLAHAAHSSDAEWRGLVGKGDALEQLGKRSESITHYLQAEDVLTDLSFLVPLGEGRGTFLGDRTRSARSAVDALVRSGRVEEALAVVRRSRARVVAALTRTARLESFGQEDRARWEQALGAYRVARAQLDLEARDDWKLARREASRVRSGREGREAELRAALDAAFAVLAGSAREGRHAPLAALPADATTLAFHPAGRGYIGIVADASGISTFTIEDVPDVGADPASVAMRLLEPIRGEIGRARTLRILPFGPIRAIDFHALPYDGEPLVAKVAVEYPLDLPSAPRPDLTNEPRALVISDPTLDLALSRSEAEHVAAALRDSGEWKVEILEGPEATSQRVLAAIPRATLLHYAGHGVFAGREGWESALPLAAGGHLAIGDILAAEAVPPRVILSGCETARASYDAPAESLGLAQAFVASGADLVIAPVRPVSDELAARMSKALYGALAQRGDVDAALRSAQLRVRSESPDADWSAFRVLRR